jgi:DNA-binding LytR/AlgR family response regulator
MKDIKVLILEDQLPEASYLRDKLINLGYQVPAVATSLSEGLEYFSMYQPDISLVDIYLDGKPDGIVYGMKMCEDGLAKKPFLFLTGSVDTSTFSLARLSMPYHYLIKPFNEPEIQYAIELALERYKTEVTAVHFPGSHQHPSNSVFVKRGNTLVNILYDEIKYIEVDGKYSKLICYNQKFIVQQSLGELHNSLPTDQFLRVHRRYVINLKEINRIDTQTHEIFFKDGNTLFFSRRYLEEFLNIFKFIK